MPVSQSLAAHNRFSSMSIPASSVSNAALQDQVIYLTLLASYQRAFAANPAFADLFAAQAPTAPLDPFAAIGSISPSMFAPSVSCNVQTPLSPPQSPPEFGLDGTISPDALTWKHEEESAFDAGQAAEELVEDPRRLSPSPPPVPVVKSPSGSVSIGLLDFETYVQQVETEMDGSDSQGQGEPAAVGGGAIRGKVGQAKSARNRRAPLSPTELTQRRDKNLQAARRCRLRKALRVRWLEARCEELERENGKIESRIADLERRLAERKAI